MRKLIAAFAAALALILCTSCSGYDAVNPAVVGTWEFYDSSVNMPSFAPHRGSYTDGTGFFEFKQNGTALLPVTPADDGGARSVKCDLSADADTITVSYEGLALISGDYVIKGDTLTITNAATGNIFIFTRVKSK